MLDKLSAVRSISRTSRRCRSKREGMEQRALFDEPFVLAVPETHPLAKQRHAKVSDMENETLLLLDDGHCLRDQALEVCSRTGVNERQDFRATSLETLRQMVAAGVGATLLPALASHGAYGRARGVDRAVRETRAAAAHRRRVAQEHGAARRHRGALASSSSGTTASPDARDLRL